MKVSGNTITWLHESKAGYVRFKASELFQQSSVSRQDLLEDPFIVSNKTLLQEWDQEVLTRHDKADLLIHRLALLADLGIKASDPGITTILQKIMNKQDSDGIIYIRIQIPKVFGGDDKPEWMWTLCDFPQILYALQKMGMEESVYNNGLSRLIDMADENGYRCRSSKPKFKGPGSKTSICPYGNLLAAKALGLNPKLRESEAAKKAVGALLHHWEVRKEKKYFLFGIGTDFKKLKFPLIWYNLLHVVDTISLYPFFHRDKRFLEMWELLVSKADDQMRFTPESMYRVYKEEDFSNKKKASPTITLFVYDIARRLGELEQVS
ncbi:MAG: hypothetical protein JXJ04_13850 [Spirochaetales bacterium]|nr:hypothetical protein [Spirochaetales bacterium]